MISILGNRVIHIYIYIHSNFLSFFFNNVIIVTFTNKPSSYERIGMIIIIKCSVKKSPVKYQILYVVYFTHSV